MKTSSKSKRGKLARAAGARFELKVRSDLEKDGWILDKWTNNVDLEKQILAKAKRKFNFFSNMRILGIGTGFPDFIAFKRKGNLYEIIGVEVKGNGWLDKTEKKKCKFLLDKKVFSKILVAKKGKERGKIDYIDFAEKHNNV